MRRLAVITFLFAGIAFSLVAVVVTTLLTLGEPRMLTNAVAEWALSRAVGSPVRVAGSSGSPLFGLELSGVEIDPVARERFEIERVRIEIVPSSLLGDEIQVRHLRIDGLHIDGLRSLDGRWSWAAGEIDLAEDAENAEDADAPPAPAASPVRVRVRTFELDGARLQLEWARPETEAGLLEARLDVAMTNFAWPMDERIDRLPAVRAELSEIRARSGQRSIDRGRARLRREGGGIEADITDVSGPWGTIVSATATVALRGTIQAPVVDGAHGELEIASIDPAPLVGVEAPASSLSGRAVVDWRDARAAIEADLGPSVVAGIGVESVQARGEMWREAGALQFDLADASAKGTFGRVAASLAGDLDGVRAGTLRDLELDLALVPESLRPSWLAAGRLHAEGAWRGPWSSPTGELSLRLDDARVADVPIDSAEARLEVRGGGRLRIETLRVRPAGGALDEIAARRPFELEPLKDGVAIHGALLGLAGGSLGIEGRISADGFGPLELEVQEIDVAALPFDGPGGQAIGGRLDGAVSATGSIARPVFVGQIDWSKVRVGAQEAERVRVVLEAADGGRQGVAASIDEPGRFEIAARGAFETRDLLQDPARLLDDATLELDIDLRSADVTYLSSVVSSLSSLSSDASDSSLDSTRTAAKQTGAAPNDEAAAASAEPPPSGTLTGRARVRGPLRFPLIEASLQGSALRFADLPESELEVDVDAMDPSGRASLHVSIGEAGRRPLALDLTTDDRSRLSDPMALATTPGTSAHLVVDGLDLDWLEPFGRRLGITADGSARGEVRLESAAVPSAVGALHVDALTLDGPGLPFGVGPIPARFDFAGDVARSTELTVKSKRGDAGVRAQVSWADPKDLRLQVLVRASDFAIDVPGVIVGRVDGDATVEGPAMALDATGGFVLHHARIDLPDPQNPVLREIQIRRRPVNESATRLDESARDGVYDAAAGEVTLEVGESVWLRGLGAELELAGQLVAKKERQAPAALYGSVEVASGRVDFQGRWLRITSGSAVFDGSPDPDPFVDATAMHRIDQVTIHVRLHGRASDLQLELDSEPPMPVEDQLSYLVFDRPASEISASEQQNISAAAMAASELLLGRLGNELAREVGLDRVRLGVDEDDAPVVEVEKRLHDRVTVRYGRSFGSDGADRFVLEWRLFRELFLSGEQQTDGESGADVFWRHDY